jgi:hypothetical protein
LKPADISKHVKYGFSNHELAGIRGLAAGQYNDGRDNSATFHRCCAEIAHGLLKLTWREAVYRQDCIWFFGMAWFRDIGEHLEKRSKQ